MTVAGSAGAKDSMNTARVTGTVQRAVVHRTSGASAGSLTIRSHRMQTLRPALLILLGRLVLLLGGCGGDDPDPAADARTRGWLADYTTQLDRWADGAAE